MRIVMAQATKAARAPVTAIRTSLRKRKVVDDQPNSTAATQSKEIIDDGVVLSESKHTAPRRRGRPKIPSDVNTITTDSNVKPEVAEDEVQHAAERVQLKRKRKRGAVSSGVSVEDPKEQKVVTKKDDTHDHSDDTPKKVVRKRKTKEEKATEAIPLAARTSGLKMFVGAHVSIAKGLENAVTNCLHIGGNAFALFLKSQRKWDNPALKDENKDAFRHGCSHHQYNQAAHVVPHGSYLVNLASADKDMSQKSYDAFLDDLRRCEALGIRYYNFHPGSANQEPLDEAIGRLASNLNRALAATTTVTPLLENMAGHGSIIGSRFSDLRDIIAAIKPEFRTRIGICIDTCHAFAAGYDLRTAAAFQETLKDLDNTVGLKYLKAMHINDSKAPFNSHRDLHQNIGLGFLGLRAFHNVMNDARLQNIPLILETPCDRPDPDNPKKTIDDKSVWAREIKLLESLIGMDTQSKEFQELEKDLSAQGQEEREKMEASVAAREEKARKKAVKELEKGQKSIGDMFGKMKKKTMQSSNSSSGLSDIDSD